jgi:conserved oligomeric Golgi complex subunit 1
LLRHVDRQLASPQASPENLAEAMCAFCLANSSSSSDALHHFLRVQHEGIRNTIQVRQDISGNVLKPLNVFIRTHQVTKALFPRRLAEALAAFRSHPLMAHPDILLLEELDLEIHGRWIEDEVRNFTPWIKAESIPKPELDQIMDDWGTNAFSVFVKGLTTNLKAITDFSQLVIIRKSLLDAWLPVHYSLASSSYDVLDGLRDVINEQLLGQIQRQAERLDLVGARISSALDSWRTSDDGSPKSLWDESLINMDFSSGGGSFKREIMNRSRGGDLNILRILKPYHDYLSAIRSTESSIRELRTAHWDDCFDDEGEEFSVEAITSVLNEDDPNTLEEMLQAGLRTSFQSLQSSILSALRKVPAGEGGDWLGVLIRVIREIRNSMPESVSKADFCADSMDEIHRLLAEEVCRGISNPFKRSVEKSLKRRHVMGRSLWEGEPPFPIQPSPPTFNLLKQMARSMSDHGADLWSPSAVAMLKISAAADAGRTLRALIKEHAGNQLVNGLKSKVDEVVAEEAGGEETSEMANGSSATNGGDDRPQSSEMFREANLQLLFDAYYLQAALGGLDLPREKEEGLEGIILELNKDMRMEGSSVDRLREGAAEYWRRTNLLFGLLLPKGL